MNQIVIVMMHPLAWKVLQEQYEYDGKAVDVGKGWLYNVITQALQRKHRMSPWEFKRQRSGLVEGKVYISGYDAERYGCFISLTRAANISCIIYKMERERLCNLTLWAHVIGGAKRDAAMRHFLWKEGYEDHEMSFDALRKYYQRHFREREEYIAMDMNDLNDNN